VRKLNIGGFAVHPWNAGASGSPRTATRTKTSLTQAYMPRLHRLMDGAVRRGRIGPGKGIWVTEFGYQSNPPDPDVGVPLDTHARYINESDRLFFGDRRVRSVAQYELADVPQTNLFNTGLRFARSHGGRQKPAYAAYRMPIVVTRRSANSVEVYGQVRPARLLPGGPFTTPLVQVLQGGTFVTVATPTTTRRGTFRINLNRLGAAGARWRVLWGPFSSRVAGAGRPLRYRRG
jgi:hypothetical protein